MPENTARMPMDVRIKLSAMMFMQFMLFAAFWVPLGGYLSGTLGFTVSKITLIMTTMAFGCMLSPIIGMIARVHAPELTNTDFAVPTVLTLGLPTLFGAKVSDASHPLATIRSSK